MDKETGIYVFENRVEHKAYVGQSSQLSRRIKEHYVKRRNYTDEFHQTLIAHPEYFIHAVVEYCSVEELDSAELKWMELYKENGWDMYNKLWRPIPTSRGKKHPHSEEHRKKISEAMKGKQTGENNHMYGKHHSEETRKKMSDTLKGVHKGKHWIINPETGKRMWI